MALQLAITEPNGITLNYHRISGMNVDYNSGNIVVRVMSYVSQEIRSDSVFFYIKERILTNTTVGTTDRVVMPPPADQNNYLDVSIHDSISREFIYNKLKEPYFVGAIDV